MTPTTDLTNLTNDFTVAAWIKPAGSGFGRIISTDRLNFTGGYGLAQNGTGLWFTTYGVKDYATSSGYLTPGIWQHVAVYLNSSNNAEFYVNGVLVETVTHNAPAVANANTRLLIGATTDTGVGAATIQHFSGAIDSPTVASGQLVGSDWDTVFGMQPTLHVPFDELLISDGLALQDASGLGSDIVVDDPNDHGESFLGIGHVGAGSFTTERIPNSTRPDIYITPTIGTRPSGDEPFSIAMWANTTCCDAVINLNAAGSAGVYYASNSMGMFGDMGDLFVNTTAPNGTWRHYVWVYTGSELIGYMDGVEQGRTASTGSNSFATDGTEPMRVNMSVTALDDLRVYQRVLSSSEIAAMSKVGYLDATIASRAVAAESGTWTGSVPADVEGFYDLFVRGGDVAGNVDEEPQPDWSGIVDTKPPTVVITEIPQGGGAFLYDILALDFAVDENSLFVPASCTNFNTTLRETNESPWVLALGDQLGTAFELVTAVEITCETSSQLPADAVLSICDVAGNCVYKYPDDSTVPTAVEMSGGAASAELTAIVTSLFAALLLIMASRMILVRRRRLKC